MNIRGIEGGGSIESHAIKAPPKAFHEVVALDNLPHGSPQAETWSTELGGQAVPFISGRMRWLAPVVGMHIEQLLADFENSVVLTLSGPALARVPKLGG